MQFLIYNKLNKNIWKYIINRYEENKKIDSIYILIL